MTTYRIYHKDKGPHLWVEYVEADDPMEALSKIEAAITDWPFLEAQPLPEEMDYRCLCSQTPVNFKRITWDNSYHTCVWQCQNCQMEYIAPPDEIDWGYEAMTAAGYQRCVHQGFDAFGCPRCAGLGWWRDGDDNEEDFYDPYYEDDAHLELED
jgi:hypothetical protein